MSNWKQDIKELRRWIAISEQRKFIYFKPARTAGTSILRFKLQKEVPKLIIGKDNPVRFNNWLQKTKRLTSYYKFTIIRNPLDRFVSLYYMYNNFTKFKIDTFEEFIKERLYKKDPILIDHAIPLTKFVKYADFVGRYETFVKDWNIIRTKIKVSRGLKHVSKTNHFTYASYYDKEMIEILRSDYKEDFKLYGI